MANELLPFGQSLADKHRVAELKWRGKPPGIPPEMAVEFMEKLKAGSTVRKLTAGGKILGPAMVSFDRFKEHCELNPRWAAEARRISDANGRRGKGVLLRQRTHCKNGHSLKDAFVRQYRGWTIRACKICESIRRNRGGIITPEVITAVRNALDRGVTINQIMHGRPAGGGAVNPSLRIVDAAALARYRRENPDFHRYVIEATKGNQSRGLRIRWTRVRTSSVRDDNNEYYKIRDMIPEKNPHRDDIVARIFEDLLGGSLKRDEVPARVKVYISELNKLYPTKYAKFGDARLVSLDEVLYDSGTATRGDTVSRGLWD
jgi:hypothetical protein